MPTLADVFRELNSLKENGSVRDYAIGGATAVLFYAEPSRTYDVDVFVRLMPSGDSPLENIFIHDVPVQFLPAHNALAEEAISSARTLDYDGVPVRVIGPEYLAALAFQAGGAKRRERAWLLLESGTVDRSALRALLAQHAIKVDIGDAN